MRAEFELSPPESEEPHQRRCPRCASGFGFRCHTLRGRLLDAPQFEGVQATPWQKQVLVCPGCEKLFVPRTGLERGALFLFAAGGLAALSWTTALHWWPAVEARPAGFERGLLLVAFGVLALFAYALWQILRQSLREDLRELKIEVKGRSQP